MPHQLKPFYLKELEASQAAFKLKDYITSWNHLERAHILVQPYPKAHTQVHWEMLCFGIKIKNLREVIGQLPRLILAKIINLKKNLIFKDNSK
jgi:hypothetical protein